MRIRNRERMSYLASISPTIYKPTSRATKIVPTSRLLRVYARATPATPKIGISNRSKPTLNASDGRLIMTGNAASWRER